MQVSDKTIQAIRRVLNGDEQKEIPSEYRRAVDIYDFFGQFDTESFGGSRWSITEGFLHQLNGSDNLRIALEKLFHPTNYLNEEYNRDKCIAFINRFLEFDGYKITLVGSFPKVVKIGNLVEVDLPSFEVISADAWASEHLHKCREKISAGDYSGAITNARSMIEDLELWIISQTGDEAKPGTHGDLLKINKLMMQRLEMDPDAVTLPLKQILSGFISIINGLASLRNKASDAHGTTYKPAKRHAILAVNTANTVTSYLLQLINDKNIGGFAEKSTDATD